MTGSDGRETDATMVWEEKEEEVMGGAILFCGYGLDVEGPGMMKEGDTGQE